MTQQWPPPGSTPEQNPGQPHPAPQQPYPPQQGYPPPGYPQQPAAYPQQPYPPQQGYPPQGGPVGPTNGGGQGPERKSSKIAYWSFGILLLVAGLVVAAAVVKQNQDDDTVAAEQAPTAPETVDLAHSSGAFSISIPDNGWGAQVDQMSTGDTPLPVIRVAADLDGYIAETQPNVDKIVPGFSIMDATGTGLDTEYFLGAQAETFPCSTAHWEGFQVGDFTGHLSRYEQCPDAGEGRPLLIDRVFVFATAADGRAVYLSVYGNDGEVEDVAVDALRTFTRP